MNNLATANRVKLFRLKQQLVNGADNTVWKVVHLMPGSLQFQVRIPTLGPTID